MSALNLRVPQTTDSCDPAPGSGGRCSAFDGNDGMSLEIEDSLVVSRCLALSSWPLVWLLGMRSLGAGWGRHPGLLGGCHPGVVMENMIRQTQQFEGTRSTLWKLMILISRRISARYGLRGVRVGEATHTGPPRIRVLLDPASQWSEVPTTVAATSREIDAAHRPPPSTVVASAGEVARVLDEDVPSTVVGSSRLANRDDVVSESSCGEGSGVRGHRPT